MRRYIFRRIAIAVPLIIFISIVCFALIQLAPFNAVDAMVTPNMSQKTVALIKAKYGLDKPTYVQYFYWIKGILRGQFGYSIVTHQSIGVDLSNRIPSTIMLVLPAYIIALILSLIFGLVAGANKGGWIDRLIDGFCSIGIAIPSFWLAIIIVYIFGYKLKIFPIIGMHTIGREDSIRDSLMHFVMPVLVLTIAFMPEMIRYVRSSTLSQLSEDYVMVQDAYGASRGEILKRHVLKNVLLPIVTLVGMSLPILVTGAFVTETIFAWPGVGPYFVKAIQGFDYPVVMAVLLLSSSLVIIGNLASDILYSVIDPRIKDLR